MSDVLERIRAKYPEYDSIPDAKLTVAIGDKYPSYLDRDQGFREEYTRYKYPGEARVSAPDESMVKLTPTGLDASGAWRSFRQSEWGKKLFGPTEVEKEAGVQSQGSPGEAVEKAMEFTSMPPPLRSAINYAIEKTPIEKFPVYGQEAKAVVQGVANVAETFPLLPLGGGVVGKTAMGVFTGKYIGDLPEAKKAFTDALAKGDAPTALRVATETFLGGALVTAGAVHTAKDLLRVAPQTAKELAAPPKADETPVAVEATQGAKELMAEPKAPANDAELRHLMDSVDGPGEQQIAKRLAERYDAGERGLDLLQNMAELAGKRYAPLNPTPEDLGAPKAAVETVVKTIGEREELRAKYVQTRQALADNARAMGLEADPKVAAQLQVNARNLKSEVSQMEAKLGELDQRIQQANAASPMTMDERLAHDKALQEQPPTPGEQNASGITKATEVHGDLQPQPVPGEGEVPKPEGGKGVQPQTEGGLQPAQPTPSGGAVEKGGETPETKTKEGQEVLTRPEQALGVVPPGFATASKYVKKLQQAWEGIKTAYRTSPNKDVMAAHMDAADNAAKILGDHMGTRVRLMVPDEQDRKAVTFIIEAKNAESNLLQPVRQTLIEFLQKTTGKNLEATQAIEHALRNEDRLRPFADAVGKMMEDQMLFERAAGVDTDNIEGYIKHAHDMDMMMGKTRPVIIGGGGGGGPSSSFAKQRAFPTYADAIEAGRSPMTLDSATLVNSRIAAGMRMVNRIQWGNALRNVVDPTSNKPIVTELITQPKGTQVAPAGYTTNEIVPGVRVAVHEGYERIFEALKGASRLGELEVKGIPIGKLALNVEAAIKHGMLAFDTFHASRIMQKELFLTGSLGMFGDAARDILGKPGATKGAGFRKGKTLLEYSDEDLGKAVQQGLITQDMADYATQSRPKYDALVKEGYNVGRIQEALYADVVKDVPFLGKVNDWIFNKLTRGAMVESGIIEFDRIKAANPGMTDQQVARQVAKDLNAYFGNLGRQGVFKSKTFQDLARLTFLAPQWVESMARTEVKSAGQLARAPFDVARGRAIGSLAKGTGQGLVAYFVATQLLNLATRHQFTFQNSEKDHKLDAWIPDVTGKTPGFFISPFSVVAEITHDIMRYDARKDSILGAVGQIVENKFSPLTRAEEVLRTGRDYSGQKLYGTWERVKAAAWSVAPTPLPLSGPIKGTSYPGQVQRQITGSLGFKTEPARTEVPEIVAGFHISSRAGMEEYLNSVASHARKLPRDEQLAYVRQRMIDDQVSPRYRKEAENKLKAKLKRQ